MGGGGGSPREFPKKKKIKANYYSTIYNQRFVIQNFGLKENGVQINRLQRNKEFIFQNKIK